MAIINCKDCGKVCIASLSQQCAACQQKTRQAEVKVAEYLEGRQNATLEEIQQATGVERPVITEMIRKGHISAGTISYPCENCRELITTGRLCQKCAGQVVRLLTPREPAAPGPDRFPGVMHRRRLVFRKA